jgi:ubiquinone/menaquinone biosynthesis C-methylase UbiE
MPTPLLAAGYDVINAVIWMPTGIARIRDDFVASLDLRPGAKVLEIGCGTGAITKRLLAAGTQVTALDRSDDMLAAARRRAPGAAYRSCDVTSADLGEGYDWAVLAFVLHELPSEKRRSTLAAAARTLGPAAGSPCWSGRYRTMRRVGGSGSAPSARSSRRMPSSSSRDR